MKKVSHRQRNFGIGILSAVAVLFWVRVVPAAQEGATGRTPIDVDRAPLRVIKDSYPSFSAVAVNPDHDMLVVTDENLFRILEYDRLANTPPKVAMTEPKRVISGTQTFAEMMCGVYIDPKSLEIYVTNNDTQNWMPVFSREARGNAKPSRVLAAPHTAHGIAVHEERQEIFLTIQNQNAVVVYRKTASGNEPPLRVLGGDNTRLADPHGVALDTGNNLLFVSNFGSGRRRGSGPPGGRASGQGGEDEDALPGLGRFLPGSGYFEPPSITVYPLDAPGNVTPLRIIQGPKTRFDWPSLLAVHEERGEIFVANDADDSVLVFRTSDQGDVAPTRVIK